MPGDSPIVGVSYAVDSRLTAGHNLLVKMQEHFDPFLQDWQLENPMFWRDRIPKGTFPLFSGTSQKSYIFRGTLATQAGLAGWDPIEESKPTIGGVVGTDACRWNPSTLTWSFEAVDFSGERTSWRSPILCAMDMMYQDKAREQIAMIMAAAADATDQIRETFNREKYTQIAAQAGKFVVLAEGLGVDFIDNATFRVTYDPHAVDADGDTYVEFDASLLPKVSTLSFKPLQHIRNYMTDACPGAAQGKENGASIFGLALCMTDFEDMVLADDKLREDFRNAIPTQLIKGFDMGFKVFRGFMPIDDPRQMRFNASYLTGTKIHCKRVLPRRATRPGIIGLVPETNPAYITAELGTAVVFLNQVMQILVPDPINNLGSGMTFGPAPGFNGQWKWINNPSDTNPLGEFGYFFSRYMYWTKLLRYATNAMVILYRRCTYSLKARCEAETDDYAETESSIAVDAVAADVDDTAKTVTIALNKRLSVGVGGKVTITKVGGTTVSGYVAESAAAPTYVFVYSGTLAHTDLTANSAAKVTVA